jgi:hypothetical protein
LPHGLKLSLYLSTSTTKLLNCELFECSQYVYIHIHTV